MYYLSADDQQIWRIEPNGRSLTQITRERAAVTEFDVCAIDGALAYVTENTLVRAEADGTGRTLLVSGPALSGAEGEAITSEIHRPRWTADGQSFAYGLNGANLIPAAGGEPRVLLTSDPIPASRSLARFYRPYAWSPDGTQPLVTVNYWQEGPTFAVYKLNDGALVHLPGQACCAPTWGLDSQSLFFASDETSGLNPPGLWRVPADGGEISTAIDGGTHGGPLNLVAAPQPAGREQIFFLMTTVTPNADGIYDWPLFQVFRLSLEAVAEPTRLRDDALSVGEAVWATGSVGVAIREIDLQSMPSVKAN